MYKTGQRTHFATTLNPIVYKTLDEAKYDAEKLPDSKCQVIIKEFGRIGFLYRIRTIEGYIWVHRY